MKYKYQQIIKNFAVERGQILILVLILMSLGALILSPLLSYMGTGLKTGQVFEQKTAQAYAADAGINDGTWQIKYNHLETNFPTYNPYDYASSWDYNLPETVNNQDVSVNIQNVWMPAGNPADPSDPLNNPPDPTFAQRVITGTSGNPPKVVITSSITSQYTDAAHPGTIEIKVQYYPDAGDDLRIRELGVWLPQGFTYRSDLGSNIDSYDSTQAPDIFDHAGGTAISWIFNDWPYKGATGQNPFPNVNPSGTPPLVSKITFSFNAPETGESPQIISWINTNLDLTGELNGNITYTWDGDVRVYHLTSVAASVQDPTQKTQIESYLAKNELRAMGSAISGDYYATGNSNLSDSDNDKCRETWHDPSSASVTATNIPSDADVAHAYLYWSGWKNDNSAITVFSDPASSFNKWTADPAWDCTGSYGRFTGYTYGRTGTNLTLKDSLDLSSYSSGLVTISWNQYKSGIITSSDGLDFAFSKDGGINWGGRITAFRGPGSPPSSFSYTIPAYYLTSNFKVRFYLVGFGSYGQYCYLDNITITAMQPDTSVVFKIDDGSGAKQVYFDGNGQPQQGNQELTASRSQSLRNFAGTIPHGFSYSSFRDVTALVRKYSKAPTAPATNLPGYATYWVGGISADASPRDEWAYACWSLVIIYTSPETRGHQLYLYDDFTYSNDDPLHGVNVDFDGDGQPGGTISGFIVPQPVPGEVNAGKITTFVGEGDVWYTGDYVALNGTKLWDGTSTTDNSKDNPDNVFNSTSMGLNTYDGIDVDTLGIDPPNGQYITWNSNLLKPGDTSAHIDMVTHIDVWNLVYIIISFRSQTITGGTLSYLIKK